MDPETAQESAERDQLWASLRQLRPAVEALLAGELTGSEPDVAVFAIGLPLLDGNEVARRIRAAAHDKIFLIALTAYCQPSDRLRALASGFDAFLCKPADLDELARLLGRDVER